MHQFPAGCLQPPRSTHRSSPNSLRCITLLVASSMLAGCATSQLHKDARFIQPGVTTRTEVWDTLGPADRVVQGKTSETLYYIERERNPLKSAVGLGSSGGPSRGA